MSAPSYRPGVAPLRLARESVMDALDGIHQGTGTRHTLACIRAARAYLDNAAAALEAREPEVADAVVPMPDYVRRAVQSLGARDKGGAL